MESSLYFTTFAGVSSSALKRVHLQRLMAFAVVLVVCTLVSWQLMIVCWTITPYMPVRGSGILGDFLSVLAASFCHSLAAFSRYLVCDADGASGRRRLRRRGRWNPGGYSYTALALPSLGQKLATVVSHGLVGASLGFYAWNVVGARAGELEQGSGALAGLVFGGAVCGGWSAVSFMKERRYQLRYGLPDAKGLPSYLWGEARHSAREGLFVGGALAAGYLVLRLVGELLPGGLMGRALAALIGLPAVVVGGASGVAPETGTGGEAVASQKAGRLVVTYLVFLSTAVNFSLDGFLTEVMNVIIVAPQDFLRLWQASAAALGDESAERSPYSRSASSLPRSPAAMLLDSLSIGHEAVLRQAELDFLQARGLGHDGGGFGSGSSYTRGPMGDWIEEAELQRRALALASLEPPRTSRRGLGEREGDRGKAPPPPPPPPPTTTPPPPPPTTTTTTTTTITIAIAIARGLVVPVWAQAAKAQALQSLALKAPRDKELRAALYAVNIAQVLRTLCLELDEINLLLQASAFGAAPVEAARALWCEGRGDLVWLVEGLTSSASAGDAGRRWWSWFRDGLTPPFKDRLSELVVALRPLFLGGGGGGGGGEGGAGEVEGLELLSPARLQSAIWAAQGMSALMVCAPGESKVWSLDTMLPVVLGSLAGLLIAVQQVDGKGGGGGGGSAEEGQQQQEQQQQQQQLAPVLEKALQEVSAQYRRCLPDFRFPPVYAETINRLLLTGDS